MYSSLARKHIKPGSMSQGGSKRCERFLRSGILACLPFNPNVYCVSEHDEP